MTPEDEAADRRRLAAIAAASFDADEVRVECVYGGRVVRFVIGSLELQHLSPDVLWARYFAPAWEALAVPAPVVADTPEDRSQVVGVGNP